MRNQDSPEAGIVVRPSKPINPASQAECDYRQDHLPASGISSGADLERDHGIKISDACVYRILKRNSLGRLPRGARLRKVHTRRYQQQVRGCRIQVDVKFLKFIEKRAPLKRHQYTAINDATRIRALNIYDRHTQANAMDFIDTVIASLPFRMREARTDHFLHLFVLPLSSRAPRARHQQQRRDRPPFQYARPARHRRAAPHRTVPR